MKQSNIVSRGNMAQSQAGMPRKWLWGLSLVILVLLSASTLILAVVPTAFPGAGATMADVLRGVVGPQPVAMLESVSARLHDTISRQLYKNSPPQIQWSASTPLKQTTVTAMPKAPGHLAPVAVNSEKSNSTVVAAAPQIGWQAYGPVVNGSNVMARALISPDSARPYTGVALVRIDLSQLQLHMMPGYQEPSHTRQVVNAFPNLGMVPVRDQQNLIAAFNGGFKTVNGHYGMMVNNITLLPARTNMGTVAIYRDGHVQIGAWNADIAPSADIIAYRQNCPPLIDGGQLSPDLAYNNRNEWGYTGNTDITWRTGLGITQDGRYLIYAVGNGTSAVTLANVLKEAGAYSAIQLDINQYYAHFETYQPGATPNANTLIAQRLLDKMRDESNMYLTPNARDFFYLTTR